MDLVAKGLADGQSLLVEQHINFEPGGLKAVLIQEKGEVRLFNITQIDQAGAGVYRGVDQAQTALQYICVKPREIVEVLVSIAQSTAPAALAGKNATGARCLSNIRTLPGPTLLVLKGGMVDSTRMGQVGSCPHTFL